MREIDRTYYLGLKQAAIAFSKLPVGMRDSTTFINLVKSGILIIAKNGRGKMVSISNHDSYLQFLDRYFPEDVIADSRAANIARLRNSKARAGTGSNISFLRGEKNVQVNNITVELSKYTNDFGLFSAYNPELSVDKICFIENLELFLSAEHVLGTDHVFIHKYGRVGKDFLARIKANDVLVCPDYDLVGLNEFLVIKAAFPQAALYLPENFDALFEKFSAPLPIKQTASAVVKTTQDPVICKIRDKVLASNRFLEQEIILLKK
jgi:hypothetical protein